MNPTHRTNLALLIASLPFLVMLYLCAWAIVPDRLSALSERINGNTPETEIAAYLAAIAHGDEQSALRIWEPGVSELMTADHLPDLQARQRTLTHTFITRGIRTDFAVEKIEWWAICCMAYHRIDNSSEASGARVFILLHDQSGATTRYVVDVFHRSGRYRGEEDGYPAHQWVIRDMYPAEQEPIFWPTRTGYGGL
jgi:hypothetical protein